MRLRSTLAVCALACCLAGCASSPSKPSVSPISKADLTHVVSVICQEPTPGIAHVIDGIQNASPARMQRVLDAMAARCPNRLSDLSDYNDARLGN